MRGAFVERGIDDGKTVKRWSETTVRRVSGLPDGLLRHLQNARTWVAVEPTHPTIPHFPFCGRLPRVRTALRGRRRQRPTYALRTGSSSGLAREDVLEEIKRISLKGLLIVQVGGDVIRISWKQKDMEVLCDVLAQG